MAEWKVGNKVISIRDGMYMPKNAKGEIIERLESFFGIDFIISYVDHFGSSGTMRVAGDDMEKCVKKI